MASMPRTMSEKPDGEAKRARTLLEAELASIHLTLSPKKTVIRDLRHSSIDYLGYTFRGRNIYPSERSLNRLLGKLGKSGASDTSKKQLMKNFVAQNFICNRKERLYRQLDRKWKHYYPKGTTLVKLQRHSDKRATSGASEDFRRRKSSPGGRK